VGYGAWAIGGSGWQFAWGSQDDNESIAAIHRALELGVNWIDTAAVYGLGHSEEVVGRALKNWRGSRPYVFTKCGLRGDAKGDVQKVLSADSIRGEVEDSLRRLSVDVIDLYQIHWPNRLVPIRNTMKAMKNLVERGKIRCIGVSNFNMTQMKAAQAALEPIELVSNQVKYNLLDREIERELLPAALNSKVTIIAYSPLAKGLLTGKYTAESKPSNFVQRASPRFSQKNLAKLGETQKLLKEIGVAHEKSPAQVALNWLLRKEDIIAIPGAKRPRDVADNAEATDWRLTKTEIDNLETVTNQLDFDRISGLPNLVRGLIPH
jgi:aryl-alcohol dehydrogenase-like predicted oxidoreductase